MAALPKAPPRDSASAGSPVITARWALALWLGLLAYLTALAFSLPKLLYLPVPGRWTFTAPAATIAMGYYGLLLYGLLGMTLGYGLARIPAVGRWLARPAVSRWTLGALPLVLVAGLAWVAAHELARWG